MAVQFNFQAVDLNVLINRVVRLQSSYVRGHVIEVKSSELPPVMADEGKMRVEKKCEMAGGRCHSERSEESLNRSQRLEQREILRIRSG